MIFGRPKVEIICSGCGNTNMVMLESEFITGCDREIFLTDGEDLGDLAERKGWLYDYDPDGDIPAELYCPECKDEFDK